MVADSRDIANLDVGVLSESFDQVAVRIQELMSSFLGARVVVEAQYDLASLVVDCEQGLVFLFAIRQRGGGGSGYIRGVEAVDDAHVKATRGKEVLEVRTALRRGLCLRNDVLKSDIIREIGDRVRAELLQIFGKGRLVLKGNANREHVGKETDDFRELGHGVLSDNGADDERALSRILVEEQIVRGEECGKRGDGSCNNIIIVPLESGQIDQTLNLSDWDLLDLGRLGES